MLEAIRQHCPKASAWAEYCYSRHSHLFFGVDRIPSEEGAQQGDPLALLLFGLVLHPLLLLVKEECPTLLLNVAYLDDVTLAGSKAVLQCAYDIFLSRGINLGLHLNPDKSLV